MGSIINLGVKGKLAVLISLVSFTFLLGGISTYRATTTLKSKQMLQIKIIEAEQSLKEIQQIFSDANLLGMDIIVDHHEDLHKKVLREDEYKDFFRNASSKKDQWLESIKHIGDAKKGEIVLEHLKVLETTIKTLIDAINLGENNPEVYAKFDEVIDGANTSGSKVLNEIVENAKAQYKAANDLNTELFDKLLFSSIAVFSICLLLLWGAGIPIASSISKSIKSLRTEMTYVSGGISHTSGTLSDTAHKLAESASQSSAAIQQSVSAMAEMGAMLSQTARNAGETANLAREVLEQSQSGSNVMSEMSMSMREISEASSRLKEIVKVIEDISVKTNVINDVVFKTQLLAVNASIEAARAGQHGKGFAVVANEVASLATLSGKSSNEIRELLQSSSKKVSEIIEGTSQAVSRGESVNLKSSEAFSEIARSISSISDKIDQISAASREQEAGINQTTAALSQLNQATSAINSLAQNNASLGGELQDHTESLVAIDASLSQIESGRNRSLDINLQGGNSTTNGTSLRSLHMSGGRNPKSSSKQIFNYDSSQGDDNLSLDKSA